jgi:hypothetical protein
MEPHDQQPKALDMSLRLSVIRSHPWRSAGGCLNYESWPERNRFLALDQQLAAQQRVPQSAEETPEALPDAASSSILTAHKLL